MKNQENETISVIGYAMVASLVILVILLAFMQSSIEKLEQKVNIMEHRIDSIQLIETYPYDHSKIDTTYEVK